MNRVLKYVSVMLVCILSLTLLSGCDLLRQIIHDKSGSELFIDDTIPVITEAIRSKDVETIEELYKDPSDETVREIERFTESCDEIKEIYVDYGGYSHGSGRIEDGVVREDVGSLSGLIITDREPYKFVVFYSQYDKKDIYIDHLWIITGKTEAVENTNWMDKYHFDENKEFVFADYYDDICPGECRLIWGDIVLWDENSAVLDEKDFDDKDIGSLDKDGIEAKYGSFGGEYDTDGGYHILFYKSSKEDLYTMIFLDDEDIVYKAQETDSIGFGITGIKKMPEE